MSAPLMNVTIASIGSMNVDLISFCKRFPGPGETLIGETFQMGPGGKGANQCACAALLSSSSSSSSSGTTDTNITINTTTTSCVAMIGAVGDDVFGSNYLSSFTSSNVVTDHLVDVIKGVSTGVAPITVDSNGENSIIVIPGANNRMTVTGTLEKLELLPNLTSVLFQLEIPFEVTLACMKRCAERGIVTFFTPAPVPPEGLSDEFFKFSSVVIPNLGEALQLALQLPEGGGGVSSDNKGLETTPSLTEAEIRIKRATVAAQTIINRGAKAVCVTLGKEGVLLAMSMSGNEGNEEATTPRVLAIPAPRVARVVDTTGAGDAFSGAFAFFYSHLLLLSASSSPSSQKQGVLNWDLLVGAAKRAVFVASLSVTKKGTQSSYARRDELPLELFQADGENGEHEKEKKEKEGLTSKKWVLPVVIE